MGKCFDPLQAEAKGPEGLRAHCAKRKALTIDGTATGIEANL